MLSMRTNSVEIQSTCVARNTSASHSSTDPVWSARAPGGRSQAVSQARPPSGSMPCSVATAVARISAGTKSSKARTGTIANESVSSTG